MHNSYNENQTLVQENKALVKARVIAASKRVRRTSNPKIWIVGSSDSRYPGRFWRVMYEDDLDCFTCDCPAYEFSLAECKHVYACALFEGGQR